MGGAMMLAYEIDGFGSFLKMDDANVPSLLSLPYIGYMARCVLRFAFCGGFCLRAVPWRCVYTIGISRCVRVRTVRMLHTGTIPSTKPRAASSCRPATPSFSRAPPVSTQHAKHPAASRRGWPTERTDSHHPIPPKTTQNSIWRWGAPHRPALRLAHGTHRAGADLGRRSGDRGPLEGASGGYACLLCDWCV